MIAASAKAHKVDPDVALALAQGEGGFDNPAPTGDGGTSYGPFQLHEGGALPAQFNGRPAEADRWANSPAGIDYAMNLIARAVHGKRGAAAIAAGVNLFERPANPAPEIQRDTAFYNGLHGAGRGAPIAAAGGTGGQRQAPPSAVPGVGSVGADPGHKTTGTLFGDCGSLEGTALGFIPTPNTGAMGCYFLGAAKLVGFLVLGLVVGGAGLYFILPKRQFSKVNAATAGVAGYAAGKIGKSSGGGGEATPPEGATAEALKAERLKQARADTSHKRARARSSREAAKQAKLGTGTSYRLSPNAEAQLRRAQSTRSSGRPDRMR
jgi:hypothetical protein